MPLFDCLFFPSLSDFFASLYLLLLLLTRVVVLANVLPPLAAQTNGHAPVSQCLFLCFVLFYFIFFIIQLWVRLTIAEFLHFQLGFVCVSVCIYVRVGVCWSIFNFSTFDSFLFYSTSLVCIVFSCSLLSLHVCESVWVCEHLYVKALTHFSSCFTNCKPFSFTQHQHQYWQLQ